jgi:hypothetical protein
LAHKRLLDAYGRPLQRAALTQERAVPTVTSIRLPGLVGLYPAVGPAEDAVPPRSALLGTEYFNRRGLFERSDFERLSAALQGLQGRFILSLNDVLEVRKLFAWASIETVELS